MAQDETKNRETGDVELDDQVLEDVSGGALDDDTTNNNNNNNTKQPPTFGGETIA